MIDAYFLPGLFLLAVSVVALVGCVAAVAYKHDEWVLTLGLIFAGTLIAGCALISLERHRVRRIEARWLADHPAKPAKQTERPAA